MAGAASSNVMLAIREKKTTPTDLYGPLRLYIVSAYSEREAAAADDDLCAVRDLRAAVEQPSLPDASSLEQRRDALLAYARALALVEPRFPVSPDRAHAHSLIFTWHDAFKGNKKCVLASLHLEKAAVLFNLGAVYFQIALAADWGTNVGIRTACRAFQGAAGAFAWLRESGVAAKAVAAGATTVDVTPECAAMLEKLMLAQAQECFFKKFIAGGEPLTLCSKVARQVGIFYEEAYTSLSAPPLSQHFDKSWVSHVQLKAAQFDADACYMYSLDLHEKKKIAEEIACLKIGMAALAHAKKVAKGVAAQLLDSVSKLDSNMKTNLERAMKENDRVYLMRVPAAGSLGALPAASLVKPFSLAEALDASKERLFSSLVPDGCMKALSKNTEMLDNTIRTQAEKLQQASEITRVRLKEMDLPDSILSLEGTITLPVDLKEDVQAVQIGGGPAGLEVCSKLRHRRPPSVPVAPPFSARPPAPPLIESQRRAYRWSINGVSSLKGWTCSQVFEIKGYEWYLELNPRDQKSGDDKEYVSLRLTLVSSLVKPDTIVEASFKLLIFDQLYRKYSEHQVSHSFQTASWSAGTSCMVPLETLKKGSIFSVEFIKFVTAAGKTLFIKEYDHSVKVVRVINVNPRPLRPHTMLNPRYTEFFANTTWEKLKLFVKKPSIFNEAQVYTWEIENTFPLNHLGYSPEFEVGGYKWFISMCPSQDGNHLSLYLKMKKTKDFPKNSAILVEFTLSIKNQETGKHQKATGWCPFAENGWGWSKFISLENLKDSSNGYHVKTKCYIEAEVAIVGSSTFPVGGASEMKACHMFVFVFVIMFMIWRASKEGK